MPCPRTATSTHGGGIRAHEMATESESARGSNGGETLNSEYTKWDPHEALTPLISWGTASIQSGAQCVWDLCVEKLSRFCHPCVHNLPRLCHLCVHTLPSACGTYVW